VKQYVIAAFIGTGAAISVGGCQGSIQGGEGRGGGDNGGLNSGGQVGTADLGGTGLTGGMGPTPVSACSGETAVAPGRWRRLTTRQYANTVRDLLGVAPDIGGFVADGRTGPFTTNTLVPLQEIDVDGYGSVAATMAQKAVANLATLTNCNTASVGEDKCAAQFIANFGARAYRRPLTSDETAGFLTVYGVGKTESHAIGIRMVVEAALQSPNFLYLVEPSNPSAGKIRQLTGYEIGSRLSYLLTGTMPDAVLFAAARAGALNNAEGIAENAKRMMDSPRFIEQAGTFHSELLGIDALNDDKTVSKPSAKYPSFDAAMRTAMLAEPYRFVSHVMTEGEGTIEELLTATQVFPTGPLVKTYGNPTVDGNGMANIADGSRSGLLTLASTQAVHPRVASPNAAVNRGHMVRRDFLCQTVPPPPGAVDFTLPPNADQLSAQELLREHQANPTCKGCHVLMDSIGFGFESYDLMGAYRTTDERGQKLDTSGEISGLDGGTFLNAREMSQKLAKSPEVRGCFSTQWFRFALGRDPEPADACTEQLFTEALSKGKGSLRDGLVALVTSDSFRFKGEE
jgi:Protein of unknown function (DUF1592)/Protein of unknown function (DUF1588)/Protein of unknown function (DUF1595)/Protein of unknown function (DUF1585)/Protein of unknown function (DUF1587)